jgi:hypothetical protein
MFVWERERESVALLSGSDTLFSLLQTLHLFSPTTRSLTAEGRNEAMYESLLSMQHIYDPSVFKYTRELYLSNI